ncbi:unnamed protein product [Gongylonema pulchrum]|uniref:N-acetyltransferase domain-containing protein n=1 Tax=Gongylonema pulchrum TaxID=637853 RepID=A0A183DY53_9BILA|nr:unnamed protein product [Gongylonema pulchrum]
MDLGIYVRNDNEKAAEEFRGIGMRIEDDILLRNDGTVEVLTVDALSWTTERRQELAALSFMDRSL